MSGYNDAISLVKLEKRHLEGALKLSQEFSWPYRLEDWEFATQVGEGVVLESDGEVLGTALWWCYGNDYATAGMIIVTAKAQGGGNGARLFRALQDATQGRNILLNSTQEGLPLYGRRGFTQWGMVLQHQGVFASLSIKTSDDAIRVASEADLEAIQALDAQAIGMERQALIAALANVGDVLVIERDNRISGFAIARRFGRGYVIGPVAAASADDAKRLILAHLAKLGGQFVRIDVYAHDGLSEWIQDLGLKLVGDAVSMVHGTKPTPVAPMRMFAVANQSFS